MVKTKNFLLILIIRQLLQFYKNSCINLLLFPNSKSPIPNTK